MSAYVLDQSWELEAERLRRLEEAFDPITTEHLWTLGVRRGWRCLEVGAGRGSIALGLAERVGEDGTVVAADLDVALLERCRRRNVEVVRLDVLEDALPQGEFDLVHARMVVSHLGSRRLEAVRRMAAALKPGGYLMIEEHDLLWNEAGEWPASDPAAGRLVQRIWVGLAKVLERGHHDVNWGRWVAPTLRQAGLVDVRGEGRCLIGASSVGRELYRLTALRFRDALLQMGAVTEAEFDLMNAALSRPRSDTVVMGPMFVSAWGRRPSL
jgi:SAM-dependent methyltransferase